MSNHPGPPGPKIPSKHQPVRASVRFGAEPGALRLMLIWTPKGDVTAAGGKALRLSDEPFMFTDVKVTTH